ncbi:MAG: seryl-tRNA synthetase [Parcubacteria group bacterium Athens1014_10]|nr:MAG: seryl-tRNA synthetase [Parcubacteria group bacterium Athens1014_10]TSD04623.1 MAG: seryl-tRNA synthetase [Parcubacteria group bacterium Athens0714_12]
MIDLKLLRENPQKFKKSCQDKQVEFDIDKFLKLDEKRRTLLQKIEKMKAKQNKTSKEIANLQKSEQSKKIKEMRVLVDKIKNFETNLEKISEEWKSDFLQIPNPPLPEVKAGKSEEDNEILKHYSEKTKFDFPVKDYLELNKKLNLIDIERASKVSGTRFSYLKNEAVLLEFALIQFAYNLLIKEGFIPVLPPVLIREKPMEAMGYLARGRDEVYYLPKDELYLIGTAEQSIGPMYGDEILSEKELPKRYLGFSTCFRREAGASGKDTKGILRVHQFDKIEMFSFCFPEKSKEEHLFFLSIEEKLMQALKLPYQVLNICSADLGDPAAAKYDIETWMPGQKQYRETHSTSNCTDFQARRLNIRFKAQDNKLKFVHTVNGTAFAVGRIIIAILENYQTKEGNIIIPEALKPYLNGLEEIKTK